MKSSNPATVARINQVDILIINEAEKRIPIKPICEALGVDYSGQLQKLKEDEILSSVMGLRPTTGKDGKTYQMQTIPYKFVFGWLFTINQKNVAAHAQEAVLRYKLECYEALYYHFTAHAEFLEEKQILLEQKMAEIQDLKTNFREAKNQLTDAEKSLREIRDMKFEDWDAKKRQLSMAFSEE